MTILKISNHQDFPLNIIKQDDYPPFIFYKKFEHINENLWHESRKVIKSTGSKKSTIYCFCFSKKEITFNNMHHESYSTTAYEVLWEGKVVWICNLTQTFYRIIEMIT